MWHFPSRNTTGYYWTPSWTRGKSPVMNDRTIKPGSILISKGLILWPIALVVLVNGWLWVSQKYRKALGRRECWRGTSAPTRYCQREPGSMFHSHLSVSPFMTGNARRAELGGRRGLRQGLEMGAASATISRGPSLVGQPGIGLLDSAHAQ